MESVLNDRERFQIHQLDETYKAKFKTDPLDDNELIYFLGDRFEYSPTWSAASRKIPTYRRNNGLYVHRKTMRHLTAVDKLASLGWPVTSETAAAMGTTVLPVMDRLRASGLVGNSMHFGSNALHLFLGLVCFGHARV